MIDDDVLQYNPKGLYVNIYFQVFDRVAIFFNFIIKKKAYIYRILTTQISYYSFFFFPYFSSACLILPLFHSHVNELLVVEGKENDRN